MKNTKGFGMILAGVIIAIVAVGGIVVYKAGQSPAPNTIILQDSNAELVDHSQNFEQPESVAPKNNSRQVSQVESCLSVNSPVAGSTVNFPLTITGTIGYGCWGIFEGEAGFAHIEQGGQMISQPSVNSGLVQMTSGYYTQAEYPASFTAVIPSVAGVPGPANLVITERGDLGENGNPNPDQVIVPINLGQNMGIAGSQSGNSIPPLTQTEAEQLVNDLWAECFPGECIGPEVTIEIFDQETFVTAIYRLYSDSQANEKREGGAFYQNGAWTLTNPSITWNCHAGRGHQDYSTEPCI